MSISIHTVCIITDGLNPTQESLIDHVLKRDAQHWWHQIPNVWYLVDFRPANHWFRELRNIVRPGELLMVHEVHPGKSETHPPVAFRGPKDSVEWFKQELTSDDIVPF